MRDNVLINFPTISAHNDLACNEFDKDFKRPAVAPLPAAALANRPIDLDDGYNDYLDYIDELAAADEAQRNGRDISL